MSLRDDFEKDYRPDWETNDPAWCAYLAATERAGRIVQGLYPDFILYGRTYIRAERAIKQIKGEV